MSKAHLTGELHDIANSAADIRARREAEDARNRATAKAGLDRLERIADRASAAHRWICRRVLIAAQHWVTNSCDGVFAAPHGAWRIPCYQLEWQDEDHGRFLAAIERLQQGVNLHHCIRGAASVPPMPLAGAPQPVPTLSRDIVEAAASIQVARAAEAARKERLLATEIGQAAQEKLRAEIHASWAAEAKAKGALHMVEQARDDAARLRDEYKTAIDYLRKEANDCDAYFWAKMKESGEASADMRRQRDDLADKLDSLRRSVGWRVLGATAIGPIVLFVIHIVHKF